MTTWWLRFTIWICVAAVSMTTTAHASVPSPERTVILVSLDGFRSDYLQKYQPTNLVRLAQAGVQAERLIPAFPSLTFPNHYTLVTGLYPEHHGIIGNNFYDPIFKAHYNAFNAVSSESRWWGGEPIWVTAIKQGRTAKCMFWPGSQAEIGGVRPSEWKPFNKSTTFTECVDTVLGWLDATNKRPSFVTLYFHEPDSAGHHDGLDSPQLAEAVQQVDNAVGRLVDGIQRHQVNDVVNLVIVSDHGMAALSPDRVITLGDFVDMSKVQVDFSGALAGLRPLDGNVDSLYAELKKKETNFHLYRREQMPERLHFRDNDRIPPLVLVADEGWQITQRTAAEQSGRTVLKATHGFDPELPSMGGLFIANGPAFRRGVTIAPEENVHVYNLLCATLGLKPAPNDGDDRLARKVLADRRADAESDPAHRAANATKPEPWPGGIIPYDISKLTEAQQTLAKRAMQRWTDTGAKIAFVPRSNQVEYVYFTGYTNAGNNTSHDGFIKGKHTDVNITAFWWRQAEWMPAHELGHVLGFHHEHQRWDRDEFVTINYQNIKAGRQHDYDWIPKTSWIVSGTTYDYRSIMHYRVCWAGACESECKDGDGSSPCSVIDPVGTNYDRVIGQWDENNISTGDAEKARLVYGRK